MVRNLTLTSCHRSEHIHKLAKAQYGKDEYGQALWIESVTTRLNFGEVESALWGLDRMRPASKEVEEEVWKLIEYLEEQCASNQFDRQNIRMQIIELVEKKHGIKLDPKDPLLSDESIKRALLSITKEGPNA